MTHVFEGEFVHQNLGRIRKEFRVDQMCEWETRKAAVRGLFFCEHGIVIDTCEELDHLGEQAMQYLNITLREKDTQVIPFCADGTYWVPVEAGEAKDVRAEKWMEAEADHNTDPEEAKEFVERTGVSSLAIAIGTAHGFYAGTPVLDKERVSDCKKVVSVPLVLHGASGLSEEDVVECVQRGMCKVNFATELRVAYTDAEKQLLKENPETFDPKKLGIAAMKAVKEQTILRMKMCGCTGKVQ